MSRDHLDRAIDQVTARMTRVEDNDALAARIVGALPERSRWSGWWFQSWAPRLAMIALAVAAGIFWTARGAREMGRDVQPLAASRLLAAPAALVASVEPRNPRTPIEPGTKPVEPVEPLEPLEPLQPLDPVASLEVDAIGEDEPLSLEPLAITDLPSAEPISPR